MSDYTAKIRAKGLDATGVTEDIARQMHASGGRYMAIVELSVDETHDKADGTHKTDLVITQLEPAVDANLAEHLRELSRTCYYNRQVDKGQPTLDGDTNEPKVEDVLAAGAKHRPHPYLSSQLALDGAGENGPVCDVCGLTENAGIHRDQSNVADPFDVPTDTDDEDPDAEVDEVDEPHEFTDAGDGSCRLCERDEDATVHAVDDEQPAEDDTDDEPTDDSETEPEDAKVLTFSGR